MWTQTHNPPNKNPPPKKKMWTRTHNLPKKDVDSNPQPPKNKVEDSNPRPPKTKIQIQTHVPHKPRSRFKPTSLSPKTPL